MRAKLLLSSASALLLLSVSSNAVTFSSSPTFVQATNAPLAGLLHVQTDVESRVSVSVSDGTTNWTRNFHDFSQAHSVVLAGFKPGRTNQISVTVFDQAQNGQAAGHPLVFITPPLPTNFPHISVLHTEPAKMEPGYNLFIVQNRTTKTAYVTMLDNLGDVVWYCPTPAANDVDVRQMASGDLFIEEQKPLNRFLEVNLLGEVVYTWSAPAQYPVNNHEGLPTPHGTILYLSDVSRVVSNFPTSGTDPQAPLATATIDDNPIVEISATNGALLNAWAPIDMLDPTRVSYLTYTYQTSFGVDNEHANAIIEDPSDDSLIVSLRTQNTVFKFLRSTGQLKWILAPPANWSAKFQPYLLTPVNTPFQWSYGQHAPELTPHHTLLLYDDGNFRASPYDPPVADATNYSRAVEYSINETNMQISQVWDSTAADGDRLFTPAVGDADWMPKTGNVLITHGLISYVNGAHPSVYSTNATMARIVEMTHDQAPHIVFDVSFFDPSNTQSSFLGYLCYRCDRIPDLYAHPATPVQDLNVTMSSTGPVLRFSADPARTYTLSASTNHLQWQQIGVPEPGAMPDTFVFQDTATNGSTARFYRVGAH